MPNVLNSEFNSYVNHLATGLEGGSLKINSTTITVNLEGLKDNAAQFNSAVLALNMWTATTGLTFQQVTGNAKANITFNNDGRGASTSWDSDGAQIGAKIEVSKNWMGIGDAGRLWGTGSYGLQTFIHEIGHALGLDHGGEYNGSASYSSDRMFNIDTWQYSIMSYFDQSEYKANGASDLMLNGPMIADIMAIQKMYGKLAVNAGDTVWGAGSTVMNGATDFGLNPKGSFCIHDTGGFDTFDLSNARSGSLIDLRPGYFSDINGFKGNVSIALDTIIERVFGTQFSDTIFGNSADNFLYGNGGNDTLWGGQGKDVLDGGQGSDIMRGGAGNDSYYVDNAGDVVDELADNGSGSDTVSSSVSFSLAGAQTLGNVENLTLSGSANINAKGNALANTIIGNAGDNVIEGGAGRDILTGGAGRDTFVFGTGLAVDPVTGKLNQALINASTDTVRDFVHGVDKIALSVSTFAAFAGMALGGGIQAAQLLIKASGPAYAQDANDYLLYEQSTGILWYDENGNRAVTDSCGTWTGKRMVAIFEDTNHNHPINLDYTDFVLVA